MTQTLGKTYFDFDTFLATSVTADIRAKCSIGQSGLFWNFRRAGHEWPDQGIAVVRCGAHELVRRGT